MFGKEPAVILGALAEIVKAIIPTLILFGVIQWTGDQVAQVMFLVSVLVGSLTIVLTRSQVVPTERANAQIQTGIDGPSTATVGQVIKHTEAMEALK